MVRVIAAMVVSLATGNALADRPTFFLATGYAHSWGSLVSNKSPYTAGAPTALSPSSQSAMPGFIQQAASYGGRTDGGWINFQGGMRYWLALVQVGVERVIAEDTRNCAAFEIDLGLMAPSSLRLKASWIEVIPAIVLGTGIARIHLYDYTQHRTRSVAREGTEAKAAYQVDLLFPGPPSSSAGAGTSRRGQPRFLLRLAVRYRAIFASQQSYSVLDQSIYPDEVITFESPSYTWDLSVAASAGLEF